MASLFACLSVCLSVLMPIRTSLSACHGPSGQTGSLAPSLPFPLPTARLPGGTSDSLPQGSHPRRGPFGVPREVQRFLKSRSEAARLCLWARCGLPPVLYGL